MSVLTALKQQIAGEGFDLCAVAPAIASPGFEHLVQWIDAGYAAEMDYFANRIDAYRHPDQVLQGVKSIVVLSFNYDAAPPDHATVDCGQGRVARYAWSGLDYHDVIHPKLKRLCQFLKQSVPGSMARGIVDTAPLMEREFAQIAGLGWRAKNTLLIHRERGSYFFLACLLTDQELPISEPFNTAHCGTCTACLDACPTNAFPQPGILDASRCISYLTIEHKGPIPPQLREPIGDWIFGCDVCQEVCPWNRKPSRRAAAINSAAYSHAEIDLRELFQFDDDAFRERFRKTPFWRSRRRGLLRNAAIVLGNQGKRESIEPLAIGLNDNEPLVRGASAWALGKIVESSAHDPTLDHLSRRHAIETDSTVQIEITAALQAIKNREHRRH